MILLTMVSVHNGRSPSLQLIYTFVIAGEGNATSAYSSIQGSFRHIRVGSIRVEDLTRVHWISQDQLALLVVRSVRLTLNLPQINKLARLLFEMSIVR